MGSFRSDPTRGLRSPTTPRDGALRLRLGPGRAAMAFVAADGTVLDRSSVRCRAGRG